MNTRVVIDLLANTGKKPNEWCTSIYEIPSHSLPSTRTTNEWHRPTSRVLTKQGIWQPLAKILI